MFAETPSGVRTCWDKCHRTQYAPYCVIEIKCFSINVIVSIQLITVSGR